MKTTHFPYTVKREQTNNRQELNLAILYRKIQTFAESYFHELLEETTINQDRFDLEILGTAKLHDRLFLTQRHDISNNEAPILHLEIHRKNNGANDVICKATFGFKVSENTPKNKAS